MMITYAAEEVKPEVVGKLTVGEFIRIDDASSFNDFGKIEAKLSSDGFVTISAPYAMGASKVKELLS